MSRLSSKRRNEVLIVVPPNSNTVIDGRPAIVTRPQEHNDWSDFMSLGVLSMVCSLAGHPELRPIYADGTVTPLDEILDYISESSDRLLAVCASVLSDNYEAGLLILSHAKAADADITTFVGNDHFTALPHECLSSAPFIDYGFVGNEVVGPFAAAVADLYAGTPIEAGTYPAIATRTADGIRVAPQQPEPVYHGYSYARIDDVFSHTPHYRSQFAKRIAPRIKELIGREVSAGVPVDIGRGCVKFAGNDACTFCSIQYGGMWRNELTPDLAWQALEDAWTAGFDYVYLTADELPLTFSRLLTAMNDHKPSWWADLPADERPVLVGYARADGITNPRRAALLAELGVRQVMIGLDAGTAASLAAMNKPVGLGRTDLRRHGEKLYEQNWDAIRVARETGLLIKAGFVIGHIGMSAALLEENVDRMTALMDSGPDVITTVDCEVLSPQAGSLDYTYLTNPGEATAAAARLGLEIADEPDRESVAESWRGRDVIVAEHAMRDYAQVLMPELTFDDLAAARSRVRAAAKANGIAIGE